MYITYSTVQDLRHTHKNVKKLPLKKINSKYIVARVTGQHNYVSGPTQGTVVLGQISRTNISRILIVRILAIN